MCTLIKYCTNTFKYLPFIKISLPQFPPFDPQLEDGQTLFDYDVGLNDIVQLMVRTVELPVVTNGVSNYDMKSNGEAKPNGGPQDVNDMDDVSI